MLPDTDAFGGPFTVRDNYTREHYRQERSLRRQAFSL